jgi:hypothetical protein
MLDHRRDVRRVPRQGGQGRALDVPELQPTLEAATGGLRPHGVAPLSLGSTGLHLPRELTDPGLAEQRGSGAGRATMGGR